MNTSEEPMASEKAAFRIFIDPNGVIQIEDSRLTPKPRRGGNLSAKKGRKVSWVNDTQGACTLFFFKKLDESDPRDDPPASPFVEHQKAGTNAQTFPAIGTPDERTWTGKLADLSEVTSYEYKVQVVRDGQTLTLDPIIIVRPL